MSVARSCNLPVTEKKSMKVYDIRIKAPYSTTLSDVSGSGKTRSTLNFWSIIMFQYLSHQNIWYGCTVLLNLNFLMKSKDTFLGAVNWYLVFLKISICTLRKWNKNVLYVLMMHDMANLEELSLLSTRGRSHLDCSIILLTLKNLRGGGSKWPPHAFLE